MKTLIVIFTLLLLNVSYAADYPLQISVYKVTRVVQNASAAMILFNDEKINAIKKLKSENLNYTQNVKELPNGKYQVTFIWSRKK